ncbi:MAG: 2-oxoacid:acceptor oxidoreductase family protein [Candidatus Zixiibacteriota bacterium]|nr:MAG: 2-oxoacid:acceptor oxidoreductase family protein [candidate division Zixibacteria bacterium]
MKQYEVTFAGFGGQGIMTAGQLLAYAGMAEGKKVIWLPSYGPEMRGGTAYCTVVISDRRIGSPVINNPAALCVFNRPSFDKFAPRVKSGGLLIVNSSLINVSSDRKDLTQLLVPANEISLKAGTPKAANIVVLGAFVAASGVVDFKTVKSVVKDKMGFKKNLLEINLKVLKQGYELALDMLHKKEKV